MADRDKVMSLIGLANKAGKVTTGEFSVERAIRSGHACLVVTARDASENTKKRFADKCTYYQVPLLTYSVKADLGRITGHEERASLAVTDPGFAKAIIAAGTR